MMYILIKTALDIEPPCKSYTGYLFQGIPYETSSRLPSSRSSLTMIQQIGILNYWNIYMLKFNCDIWKYSKSITGRWDGHWTTGNSKQTFLHQCGTMESKSQIETGCGTVRIFVQSEILQAGIIFKVSTNYSREITTDQKIRVLFLDLGGLNLMICDNNLKDIVYV